MPDRRPSLLLVFAITVTGITVNTMVTPGIPDILDGLHASRSLAGVFVGAGSLPGIIVAPAIGFLADRYGRREVLLPCLVLFALAGGLVLVAQEFWQVVVLRVLQGSGSAGLINLAVVIIGDHWDGNDRATLIGRNAAVLTVALAVFPLVGGGLTDLFGWRAPFAVYPVALITAVAVARGLPRTPRTDGSLMAQLRTASPYLRSPEYVSIISATVVVFALIFGGLLTLLPVHAEEAFGLGASWRGVLLGVPAIGSTTAAFSLGRLTARLGRRRLLLTASGLFGVALVTMGLTPILPLLLVGAVLFGLGEGASIPSLQDMAAGSGPAEVRGALVATQVGGARLGQTIGPALVSIGLSTTGADVTFVVFGVAAVVLLLPVMSRATRDRQTTRKPTRHEPEDLRPPQ